MAKPSAQPILLDLEQFESIEDALGKIQLTRAFDQLAGEILGSFIDLGGRPTLLSFFFMSAVARARGLREAVVREIEAQCPPAAATLLRQLAEVVATIFYVADFPAYAEAIAFRPDEARAGAPKRKGVQALIHHMDRHHADQFEVVYADPERDDPFQLGGDVVVAHVRRRWRRAVVEHSSLEERTRSIHLLRHAARTHGRRKHGSRSPRPHPRADGHRSEASGALGHSATRMNRPVGRSRRIERAELPIGVMDSVSGIGHSAQVLLLLREVSPIAAQVCILDAECQFYPSWNSGEEPVAYRTFGLVDPSNPPYPCFAVATRPDLGPPRAVRSWWPSYEMRFLQISP